MSQRKKKLKGTPLAIQQRQQRVLEYINKGMGLQEAADILGVDRRTICRDLDVVRAELSKEYLRPNMVERVAQLNNSQDMRVKRLWSIVIDKNTSKKDMVAAISQIREEEKLRVRKDQILGILPRDTAEVQIANIVGGNQETVNNVSIFNTLKVIRQEDSKLLPKKKDKA